MTHPRLAHWRRLLGLALLACVALSSVEVVWADDVGAGTVPTLDRTVSAALALESDMDPGPHDDCACLCACACASAQQVAPAALPSGPSPDPAPAPESPVVRDRVPRAVSPQPHLRPPIA
jgi:hypothetical protein